MKQYSQTDLLLSRWPIISDQISKPRLRAVLTQMEHVLQATDSGDVAEFGCYVGTTSLFMRRLMDAYDQSAHRRLYAYDSFVGLPKKTVADASRAGEEFKGGELRVTKKQLLQEFHKAHLSPPTTTKGWFNELSTEQLPEIIAFAFLDGDFYESILDSLRLVWPRLVPGAIVTIDDYQRAALPGVERAVTDFFRDKRVIIRHKHQIAIITDASAVVR